MGGIYHDCPDGKAEGYRLRIPNQITQREARELFDYRDGVLFWRHAASGRRADLVASSQLAKHWRIKIGSLRYQAAYLVWNWHHGPARSLLRFKDGNTRNCRIENLEQSDIFIDHRLTNGRAKCPCCGTMVASPGLEMIIALCQLGDIEEAIFRAAWNAKGAPVSSEKFFDVIYADDPDGGPHDKAMRTALKFGIHRLKKKLEGTGVDIVNEGRSRGYKLIINSFGES